jgi:hypothetical protein
MEAITANDTARTPAGNPLPENPTVGEESSPPSSGTDTPEANLMDYTSRQLALYYREAMRFDAESQAGAIIAANLGFAGGKEAQRAVNRLRGGR